MNTPGAVTFAGLNGAKTTTGSPDQNKFSPRIGLAYTLNSKTTMRGGYGMFWGPQIAQGGPYLPEGFTASTATVTSSDSGATANPATSLANV